SRPLVGRRRPGQAGAVVLVSEEAQVVAVVPHPKKKSRAGPVRRSRTSQTVAGAQEGLNDDARGCVGADRVDGAAPRDDSAVPAGGFNYVRIPFFECGVLLQVRV